MEDRAPYDREIPIRCFNCGEQFLDRAEVEACLMCGAKELFVPLAEFRASPPPSPPNQSEPAIPSGLRRTCWWLCGLTLVGCVVAWIDVESIVFSGPVVCLAGAAVIIQAMRSPARLPLVTLMGVAPICWALACTFLINVNNWGPRQAQEPLSILCGVYCFGFVAVCVLELVRRDEKR